MNKESKTHESYGMVSFSRRQGDPGNLFGSSVKSGSYVALVIKRASVERDLYRDWYHGKEQLIEVNMTNTQFSELLTTMNFGDGVPCTIDRFEGKMIPRQDTSETLTEQVKNEFSKEMAEKASKLEETYTELEDKLSKTSLSKKMKEEILWLVGKSIQDYKSDIPFALKQYDEASDLIVKQAKGEIEGFLSGSIQRAGLEALQSGQAIIEVPALSKGNLTNDNE